MPMRLRFAMTTLDFSAPAGRLGARDPARRLVRYLDAHPELSRHNVMWAAPRLGVTAGTRVIDLGCGSGDGTLALAAQVGLGGRVLGVDPEPALLATAAAKCRQPQVSWHLGRCADLAALPGDADVLWCDRVLAHCRQLDDVLAGARRVLRPGGRFFSCEFVFDEVRLHGAAAGMSELREQWLRLITNPHAANQLRAALPQRLPQRQPWFERQTVMLQSRRAVLSMLGLPLWLLRKPTDGAHAAAPSVHDQLSPRLRSALHRLRLLERQDELRISIPIQWAIAWMPASA